MSRMADPSYCPANKNVATHKIVASDYWSTHRYCSCRLVGKSHKSHVFYAVSHDCVGPHPPERQKTREFNPWMSFSVLVSSIVLLLCQVTFVRLQIDYIRIESKDMQDDPYGNHWRLIALILAGVVMVIQSLWCVIVSLSSASSGRQPSDTRSNK